MKVSRDIIWTIGLLVIISMSLAAARWSFTMRPVGGHSGCHTWILPRRASAVSNATPMPCGAGSGQIGKEGFVWPERPPALRDIDKVYLSKLERNAAFKGLAFTPQDVRFHAYKVNDTAYGCRIDFLRPSSLLFKCGMRQGDVIMSFDGHLCDEDSPGIPWCFFKDRFTIKLVRRGQSVFLDIHFQ